jgi:signal transduction histidine kinase
LFEGTEEEHTTRMEAMARAQQLEAIFDSMADGVLVFDTEGNIIQANMALRKLLQMDRFSESFKLPLRQRVNLFDLRDEDGQPLPEDQWPITRILRGELLQGKDAVDIMTRQLDGYPLLLNQAGAPLRDQDNRIIGGVLVFRDVTKRRQLERRARKAFKTLLTLAEELVRIPYEIGKLSPEEQPLNMIRAVGQRLVELTCHMLECSFASIVLFEPGSEKLTLIAQLGFPPEDVEWITQEIEQSTLGDYLEPEVIARLRANEVVIRDLTQQPFVDRSPYNLGTLLIAPMIIGEQLVGSLSLEKKSSAEGYTEEEVALAKAIAKLAHLVIERERLQQEWLAARASQLALEEANRRFDEFLSIASHELRTPLTTIKGNIQLALRRLQMLKWQEGGDESVLGRKLEKIDKPLHYAERRVNVQNRMISDLLDVSHIQSGKLVLTMRPCNLVEIVCEAIEDQRYSDPDHSIILEILADEKARVIADADRISQVVHNYLSNALKYSPEDAPVIVRVEQEEDVVRVSVQDKGPGLPIEEQERIWERFYRAKGVKAQNGSGTMGMGLGLHICRTIIEYHHGAVGVQSSPGNGSTFWFTLALASQTAMT